MDEKYSNAHETQSSYKEERLLNSNLNTTDSNPIHLNRVTNTSTNPVYYSYGKTNFTQEILLGTFLILEKILFRLFKRTEYYIVLSVTY